VPLPEPNPWAGGLLLIVPPIRSREIGCAQRSISGTAKMRSSNSISAMLCSASIRVHHLVRTRNGSTKAAINDVTARVVDCAGSRQPQTLERGASRSSTDVRNNDQFENPDVGELSK